MALASDIAPYELESEGESFLNRVPKLGYYSSPRSWAIPPCDVWPLITIMALGETVVSHTHPEPTLTKQEIIGAALNAEALAFPAIMKL